MARKKKNNIEVKLIDGNSKISKSTKPDVESYNKLVIEGGKTESVIRPALLISRADHPIDVEYGDRTIRLSPRAQLEVANSGKLGELPKDVFKKLLPVK